MANYLGERPHQGKDNVPLTGRVPAEVDSVAAAKVVCEERLGGLLKHYRQAA